MSRIRPALCRKLSRSAKTSHIVQEAFARRENVLRCAGNFRTSRKRPALCRELSRVAKNSLLTTGDFRASRKRIPRNKELSQSSFSLLRQIYHFPPHLPHFPRLFLPRPAFFPLFFFCGRKKYGENWGNLRI